MKASLCPYEKTILSNQFGCCCSRRGQRGERAVIECERPDAQVYCISCLKTVRMNARFALKIDNPGDPLPFGKESKLLYGSLLGLIGLVNNITNNDSKPDIHQLMLKSHDRYGSSANIPYEVVVRHIAVYTPRRGRRQNKAND